MRNLRFIVPSRIPCRFPKNPSSHASHSRAAMQGSLGRVELGLLGTSLARQPRRPRHPLGLIYACHPLSITNHTRILMTSCSLRLHTILRLGMIVLDSPQLGKSLSQHFSRHPRGSYSPVRVLSFFLALCFSCRLVAGRGYSVPDLLAHSPIISQDPSASCFELTVLVPLLNQTSRAPRGT